MLTDIKPEISNAELAHRRMNHYNVKTIRLAQEKGILNTGLKLTSKDTMSKKHCNGCAIGKITRRHAVTQRKKKKAKGLIPPKQPRKPDFERGKWYTVEEILKMVKPYGYELSLDAAGPFRVAWDGSKYAFVLTDSSTGTQIWIFTNQKSQIQGSDVGKRLKRELLKTMDPTNIQRFYRLKSDRAGEQLSNEFHQNVARELGITDRETNVPGNSHHNERAERAIRTTTESAAANMASQRVPHLLWPEAYKVAAEIADKLPCKSNPNNYSPYQMRQLLATGRSPDVVDLSWFRIPFTRVSYVEQKDRSLRVLGRGMMGVYVGMERGTKGYKVIPIDQVTRRLRPAKQRLVAPKDIYFDEASEFPTT